MSTTAQHELPILVFAERPDLLAELLRGCGVSISPAVALRPDREDATEVARATADLTLVDEHGAIALVVEVQRSVDADKPYAWMRYLAMLHWRRRCPTYLVIVATDPVVARWAARPIETFQPGAALAPIVIGPEQIPRVSAVDIACRAPGLALLSALAHGHSADAEAIGRAALVGARTLDDPMRDLYTDQVLAALTKSIALKLEDEMKVAGIEFEYEYKSDLFRRAMAHAKRELITNQLTRKFGAVPAWAVDDLASADEKRLERIADRLLDAPDLETALRDA